MLLYQTPAQPSGFVLGQLAQAGRQSIIQLKLALDWTNMIRIAKTNGVVRLPKAKNVLGGKLGVCCTSPMTGFFRDGCCNTGPEDVGSHTVCVEMTAEFLAFSKSVGNDLSTPNLQFGFPGLQPGDRWCLCAPRWQEALDAGYAPKVILGATHEGALAYCDLEDLKAHAIDA
jgi:uncharacterized protein (DUF2237 family)